VGLVTAHTGGAGATERHEVGERQGGGGRLRGRWSRRRASWIVLRGGTHTIPGGLGEHSHGPGTGDRNTSGRRRAAAGVKTFECRMSGWPRVAVGRGLCRGLLPKGGLREEDGADAAKGGGRLWRALGWGRIPIDGEIDGYLALFVGGTPKKGKRVPNFNTVVSIFTSKSNSRKGDHKEGGVRRGPRRGARGDSSRTAANTPADSGRPSPSPAAAYSSPWALDVTTNRTSGAGPAQGEGVGSPGQCLLGGGCVWCVVYAWSEHAGEVK